MSARLIVDNPGLGVTAQDFGRPGHRSLGVPLSGALDPVFLAAAHALAGAPDTAAGLEILLAAPSFRVGAGPLRIGLAGGVAGELTRADGTRKAVGSWLGLTLHDRDLLALRLIRAPAYVSFSGGLDLLEFLGSRSTCLRAGFGGICGRTLARGDALACAAAEGDFSAPAFAHEPGPLRFIAGPEAERFPSDSLNRFVSQDWRVGADSDRMGMRLAGTPLAHGPQGANIVTDGATPGAIQVPGDGQPILLRADCQTSGGYAKIGCVISADVPRAAHVLPGESLRFTEVDHDVAAAARLRLKDRFALWRQSIAQGNAAGGAEKLWTENLISGAVWGE